MFCVQCLVDQFVYIIVVEVQCLVWLDLVQVFVQVVVGSWCGGQGEQFGDVVGVEYWVGFGVGEDCFGF